MISAVAVTNISKNLNAATVNSGYKLEEGDTFSMGVFNDTPVHWKVIDLNQETGDAVVMSITNPNTSGNTLANAETHTELMMQEVLNTIENVDENGQYILDYNERSTLSPVKASKAKLSTVFERHRVNNECNPEYFSATAICSVTSSGAHTWLADADGLTGTSHYVLVSRGGFSWHSATAGDFAMGFMRMLMDVKIPPIELNSLEFTATPVDGDVYTFQHNVKGGQKIGEFSFSGGAMPVSIHMGATSNAPAGHENDYTNFRISSESADASPVDISINPSGSSFHQESDSLNAGEYYFRIEAVDANDTPNPHPYVDVHLTVEKAQATVSFTTATQTKIKIGNTEGIYEFIETNNTDLTTDGASAVSYSLSQGVDGTGLQIHRDTTDAKKYKITIGASTESVLPATFKLKATLPATKNYQGVVSEEKEIYVYKGLGALTWVPSTTGNYDIANVVAGSDVGTLLASDGIANYTYALTTPQDEGYVEGNATDNAKFTIAETTLESGVRASVKTITSLQAGTYKLQFKVSDQAGDTRYASASITVSANAQSALHFKENDATITSKSIYFNDTNTMIYAEGGEASISSLPTYELLDQADSEFLTVSDQGNGTAILTPVKITGRNQVIKVLAKKSGNAIYDEVCAELAVTILPAKQELVFDDTNLSKRVRSDADAFFETASGSLENEAGDGVGGITYSSSNTNVVTIDVQSGEVSVIGIGTSTITAVLNSSESEHYDANYETKTISKTIEVYEGMQASWNANGTNLQAGDTAIIGGSAGTINVSNNNGAVSYQISEASHANNTDASKFRIVGSGTSASLQLSEAINGNDIATHTGRNTYKVQVIVSDLDGSITIDCVIIIDNADNEIYFVDSEGNRLHSLSKTYGEAPFTLLTHTANSGSVTYELLEGATEGIVAINGSTVSILSAGETTIKATVPASNGFKSGSADIPIIITPATQSIAFNNVNTTYQPFLAGMSISEQATLTGNPTGTISYTSETPEVCSIVAPGTVTAITEGTCTIKAANQDQNYNAVSTTKNIIFHVGATGVFEQTTIPQADNNATNGRAIGDVDIQGGVGDTTYVYSISEASGARNANASLFKVDANYGSVSLGQDIHAQDISTAAYDEDQQFYILRVQIDAYDTTTTETITIDCVVGIKGAALSNIAFDNGSGSATTKISRVYAPDDSFNVNLVHNTGNGLPVYRLQEGSPTDVIDPTIQRNNIKVLNANEVGNAASPVILVAEVPAKAGYEATTLTCEIEITKARQDMFAFANPTMQMIPNASITPSFRNAKSEGPIRLSSDNTNVAIIDGDTIVSASTEGQSTITAVITGNRNYQDGIATASLEVTSTPAYPFVIEVPSITYGDSETSAAIVSSGHTQGAQLTQAWTSSDTSIADIDDMGNITIYKAGQVSITCVQTSDRDATVQATVVLTIQPKPITVTIEDATKKVGEEVPTFHAIIAQSDLVGEDTIGQPDMIALCDGEHVDAFTPANTYTITGSYPSNAYPNYAITIVSGELTITQDEANANWYRLVGETTGEQLDPTKWHKENVLVVLNSAFAQEYNLISVDQALWDTSHILVDKEDEMQGHVYFQNSETNALAIPHELSIKIDKTKPEIVSIQGIPIEQNAISELLHQLSFGAFFKPRQEITIEARDMLPTGVLKNSGIHEVAYDIYTLDTSTGFPNLQEPYDSGTASINEEGKAVFTIPDVGLYRVCATTSDEAGNSANMKCADLSIRNVGDDSNGDGIPDLNIDLDGDGTPDLNITRDPQNSEDKEPYLNIDTTGDGKANLNIDSDQDGKPDLNLVRVYAFGVAQENAWNPTICGVVDVSSQQNYPVEYCTGTSAKAQINIDTSDNQVPNLNVDTDGDFKADINISRDGEQAHTNLARIHAWHPNTEYTFNGFAYDSVDKKDKEYQPVTNIDTDQDGYPDLNVDLTGDGEPDINIDIDGDGIPDIQIDTNGDGKADINIDVDGNGTADTNVMVITEWIPNENKTYNGIEFDTMDIGGVSELEDNDVKVYDKNGIFLPNSAIRVQDITSNLDKDTIKKLNEKSKHQDVKRVYSIDYLENDLLTQPNHEVMVKIPIDPAIKNPVILIQNAKGEFEKVEASEEDGYYVFETSYLGKVSILGDKDTAVTDPEPDMPKTEEPKDTNVKGNYTNAPATTGSSGMGGANTGDATSSSIYVVLLCIAILFLGVCIRKGKKT